MIASQNRCVVLILTSQESLQQESLQQESTQWDVKNVAQEPFVAPKWFKFVSPVQKETFCFQLGQNYSNLFKYRVNDGNTNIFHIMFFFSRCFQTLKS